MTKRAAEDVLEGMDSVVNREDHRVAEKLAMHIADVAERFDIVDNHEISCKLSFILSLLVRHSSNNMHSLLLHDNSHFMSIPCLQADLVPKGHNVLIFSQTRKMLNIIQVSLIINYLVFYPLRASIKQAHL